MPFVNNPQPPKSARDAYPNDSPLLQLTPLYPSRSGKAIMGNVPVATPKRARQGEEPSDTPFGEVLIDLIRTCMEKNRPLRFLVFESQFGGDAAYRLSVTMGNPPPDAQPKGRQERPNSAAWPALPPTAEEENGESGEPTPRPTRRGMPRR